MTPVPIQPTSESSGWASGVTYFNGALGVQTDANGSPELDYDGGLSYAFDAIGKTCSMAYSPTCSPTSQMPGPIQAPPIPLSTQAEAWSYQYIYVGSADTTTLGKYYKLPPNKQVRYLDHGRDEISTWTCTR